MATSSDIAAKCEQIRKDYSPCDVSDALLTLDVPNAGLLTDIAPIPSRHGSSSRLVAPVSTVLFVAKDHMLHDSFPGNVLPRESNLTTHFTEVAPPGSVVLMQQPTEQVVALLGDIVATRYKLRGVKGVVIDGRSRDVVACGEICADGGFQVWSKAVSSVGTSLEAKPWAADVPLMVGKVKVKPGDILVADEGEKVVVAIPQEKLDEVLKLLSEQKEADDGLLKDVQGGMDFKTAVKRWPKHYSNH